ncbi:MAG: addiction module protein [Burkholderiales bacterium]
MVAVDSIVVATYPLFTDASGGVMLSTVEALEAEALQLSASERARLIERLIASLDADPEIEKAWAAEVERRNAEIESGAVSLIPGPEALAKLKAEFR